MTAVFLLIVFGGLVGLQYTLSEPIISVPPVDTVGCYGGESIFYCESKRKDAENINWLLNSDALIEDEDADEMATRGITIETNGKNKSTLSILGLPLNDGISIGCNVVVTSFAASTISALFTVSDIPSVENLTATHNEDTSSFYLSWKEPSCLPVNYSYNVHTFDGLQWKSYATVELHYLYNYVLNMSSCNDSTVTYTFNVTLSDIMYTNSESVPALVMISENVSFLIADSLKPIMEIVMITFSNSHYCYIKTSIALKILIPSLAIHPCTTAYFIVNVSSTQPMNEFHFSDILITNHTILNTGVIKYSFGPTNQTFIGKLKISLEGNETNFSEAKVSTFNVQDVLLSTLIPKGGVNISCYYAINSFANGCQVKFISDGIESHSLSVFIPKDSDFVHIPIDKGNYTVLAHDVVKGIVNTFIAYSTEIHLVAAILSFESPSPTSVGISRTQTKLFNPSITFPIYHSVFPSHTSHSSMINVLIFAILAGLVGILLILGGSIILCFFLIKKIQKKDYKKEQDGIDKFTQNSAYERVEFQSTNTTGMLFINSHRNEAYETVLKK